MEECSTMTEDMVNEAERLLGKLLVSEEVVDSEPVTVLNMET